MRLSLVEGKSFTCQCSNCGMSCNAGTLPYIPASASTSGLIAYSIPERVYVYLDGLETLYYCEDCAKHMVQMVSAVDVTRSRKVFYTDTKGGFMTYA